MYKRENSLVPWRLSNGVSILIVRTVWPSKAFSELKKHDLISNFVNSDFFYFGFHLWIVSRMSLLVCDSCGWSYSVYFKSTWDVYLIKNDHRIKNKGNLLDTMQRFIKDMNIRCALRGSAAFIHYTIQLRRNFLDEYILQITDIL